MKSIGVYWLVVSIAILVVFLAFGLKICRRPLGILIDARNKMSLSRLQIVLWSWLIISAFFSVALARKTVDIDMDPQIWALMGISLASTTGAAIIKGTKAGQEPDDAKLTARAKEAVSTGQGVLHQNSNMKDAKLVDMVEGEEISNYSYVDITKVQMLFFTVAMVVGYAWMLWGSNWTFPQGSQPIKFPSLSGPMVTILGISHAGYLVNKAAPKTPTK